MTDVRITEAQSGQTVRAEAGAAVVVELPESPASGYRWTVDNGTAGLLEPVEAAFQPAEGKDPGGRGSRVFRFEAPATGRGYIRLKLWRAWEGEDSVSRRFEVWVET